ncbi:MAG: hypothetical protein KF723_20380 [Rhizobiaceae bacterium]|nr:hypothetical protein [Rhizobiaceae bacterium]
MDTTLISNRKREVEQEIARLRRTIDSYEVELSELDTVMRVISRLEGSGRTPPGAASQQKPAAESGQVFRPLDTMPAMIIAMLTEAREAGEPGLEPKEIARRIETIYGIKPRADGVSPICWRMWKRGQLTKDDGSPLYKLPISMVDVANAGIKVLASHLQKNTPTDLLSERDQPAGVGPEAQGREAGPGGGA